MTEHECLFPGQDTCVTCGRELRGVERGNRDHHFRLPKGWTCSKPDGHAGGCDSVPHGMTWWHYHLWVRSHRWRHPLSWGVGKGYSLKMHGEPLPWHIRLCYRLSGYPPQYRQKGVRVDREELGRRVTAALAERCQERVRMERMTESGKQVYRVCLGVRPCPEHEAEG